MALQKIPFLTGIDVKGNSNMDGNLDINGWIFDRDENGNIRNLSTLMNLLAQTLPSGYDPLSTMSITSTLDNGQIADGTAAGYVYSDHSIGQSITDIRFANTNLKAGGSTQFSYANKGTIRLLVNNIQMDSVDLTLYSPDGAPGTSPPQSGYPASGLQVSLLAKHSNFTNADWFSISPEYTRGEVTITIPTTWMQPGSNRIRVEHLDGQTLLGFAEAVFFYDGFTTPMNIINTSLTVNTFSNTRYLSGVPFGGTNTTLNVDFEISNFFGGTYDAGNVITINNGNVGVSRSLNYTSGTGYSSPNPLVGESVIINDTVTISRLSKYLTENVYVDVAALSNNASRDASTVRIYGNPPIRLLFGSSSASSTNEDFYSETYRVPASQADSLKASPMNSIPTGLFSSATVLSAGELQVYAGKLMYPRSDYSNSQPAGPNYTTATGTRVYVRAFDGFSPAEAGGKITIGGISRADIDAGNVKVEICIPGVTAWGDLKGEYFYPVDTDGDGCWYRAAGDGTGGVYGFFLGYNFANGGSANAILVRITIAESAKNSIEITSLSVSTLA